MNIKFDYSGVKMDVNLKDRICFLVGDSGTGKTFFFTLLSAYCDLNDISYCVFNHNSMAAVKDFNFESVDIVIMDNADLYMNREIYLKARGCRALVFISMKSYCGFDPGNSGEYKIDYEKDTNTIRLRRIGV